MAARWKNVACQDVAFFHDTIISRRFAGEISDTRILHGQGCRGQ